MRGIKPTFTTRKPEVCSSSYFLYSFLRSKDWQKDAEQILPLTFHKAAATGQLPHPALLGGVTAFATYVPLCKYVCVHLCVGGGSNLIFRLDIHRPSQSHLQQPLAGHILELGVRETGALGAHKCPHHTVKAQKSNSGACDSFTQLVLHALCRS